LLGVFAAVCSRRSRTKRAAASIGIGSSSFALGGMADDERWWRELLTLCTTYLDD
jgi:hypothetical protein